MRIAIVASALPGLGPRATALRAVNAWRGVRPGDDIATIVTAEGEKVAHVGTGIDDVVRARYPHAQPRTVDGTGGRRVLWTWDNAALIDLADAFTWEGNGGGDGAGSVGTAGTERQGASAKESLPVGSTSFLAEDVDQLRGRGVRTVHLHLPRLMTRSDLGLGLLGALAGTEVDVAGDPRGLTDVVATARSALGDVRLVATYGADMPLIGVDGMARQWDAAGADGFAAQAFEKHIGGWVRELELAVAASTRRSLLGGSNVDPRAGSSGPGGGLGMMVGVLGGRCHLIGDHLVTGAIPAGTELIVYVTSAIGADLPGGLRAATAHAETAGIPVVLLTDAAGMRKGELPRLGLHGSYELRPQRAFADSEGDLGEISAIPKLLDAAMARIALTWGWDL